MKKLWKVSKEIHSYDKDLDYLFNYNMKHAPKFITKKLIMYLDIGDFNEKDLLDYKNGNTSDLDNVIDDMFDEWYDKITDEDTPENNWFGDYNYVKEIPEEYKDRLFDELKTKIYNLYKKEAIKTIELVWGEETNSEDNWNYENHIDNEFEKRPNKRINRILKRMYKDAKK